MNIIQSKTHAAPCPAVICTLSFNHIFKQERYLILEADTSFVAADSFTVSNILLFYQALPVQTG